MIARSSTWFQASIAALLVCGSLLAHEDDRKILDRKPPVPGPGWRRTSPVNGGGQTLGSGGFASNGVTLLAWLPMAELDGSANGSSCWGYTSPSGREYGIIGTEGGTCFVEITNPTHPQVIGYIDGPNSLWRDVKVYQNYAYLVSEGGNGIQVVSMANIDSGTVTLVNTITSGGSTATHTVALDETSGYLYRSGGSGLGIRAYNLATPNAPVYSGSWSTRYVHECEVFTYTSGPYAGKQIAFACTGFDSGWTQPGFEILDVTNKASIVSLARILYPGAAYSHQGWLSSDKHYFYLGDELDEDGVKPTTTYVFDVSNLNSPSYVGTFTNGNKAIGHNMYVKGNLLYEANYTSGLRVFDLTNQTNPTEVAWLDTYPSGDGASFNGLWSNYPYFPSGVMIGSDIDRGLFVYWVGDPPIQISLPNGAPPTLSPSGDSVSVLITEANSGDLALGTERLFYDAGAGWVEVPLNALGGGLYDATFPALACGTSVQWYVGAESSTGIFWSSPSDAPATNYASIVAGNALIVSNYDMETTAGWVAGAAGDNATGGTWTRVDPNGTVAQAEDDTSFTGTRAWVTGQNPAGDKDNGDVDGGTTTLLSPVLNLGSLNDPFIGYRRWYSNDKGSNPSSDSFKIDISFDGGSSWSNVETVGRTGAGTSGGWLVHSFRVADFGTPNNQVKLRFVASDLGGASTVEAGIDDVVVADLDCNGCSVSNYCLVNPNSSGFPALISYTGTLTIANNDFGLTADQCPSNQFGIFFYGPSQTETPFGNGFMCINGGVKRFPVTSTDVFGQASFTVDFTNLPAGDQIDPGETVNFQFWFRDPMGGGAAFNLTNGLEVQFCQ
jgi:choice-of-anchor B domain-containing protein